MVAITKTSRRTLIEENYSLKQHKYLNRHFLHLFVLAVVATFVALYYFLLSQEERASSIDSPDKQAVEEVVREDSILTANEVVDNGLPFLIYTTANQGDDTATYVKEAIESGFRFIDTAAYPDVYDEVGVGEGWKEAVEIMGLDREGEWRGEILWRFAMKLRITHCFL